MNLFIQWLHEPSLRRFGWVLLHFLWQGTVIGLVLAVLLRLLSRASSHLRYLVICAALLACAIAPAVTWAVLAREATPFPAASGTAQYSAPPLIDTNSSGAGASNIQTSSPPAEMTTATVGAKASIPWRTLVPDMLDPLLPYAVGFWFAGVLVLAFRLALGWMQLQIIRRSGVAIPDAMWQEQVRLLAERMRVGVPVRLMQSAFVEVPALIGWLRPVILLPASVFTGLTAGQLEAILAHELAHVRRCDYMVNLLQTVIETALFYHPAVWWISGKLREERENCCDDIAVETIRDRAAYAGALAALEERRVLPSPLALAASDGSLLVRIRRIAGAERGKSSLVPMVVTTLIVGMLLMSPWSRMFSGEPENTAAREKKIVAAVKTGDAAGLEKLLSAGGVDLNKIEDGNAPLLFSATSAQVVEICIKHGADPNIADKNKTPALAFFCEARTKDAVAVVRTLLKHGADPNARYGMFEQTALMGSANGDIVDALADYGADLYAKDNWGQTALVRFDSNSDVSALEALLRHGVPFDPKMDGPTMMVHAAWESNVTTAQWLLDHKVDPNTQGLWAKDADGKPDYDKPIVMAAIDGSPKMISFLLEHGTKDDGAILFALHNQRAEAVKAFWEHGVHDISELCYAVSQGAPVADLEKILSRGNPVDPPQDAIITPLGVAARLGRMDIVQFLVSHGADVNKGGPTKPDYPQFPQTPLARASSEGQDEIVEYLLKHGAQPNFAAAYEAIYNSVPYDSQRSPEHFQKTLKLLIDAGAVKNTTPEQAGYLLSAAIGPRSGKAGSETVLKTLLDAGLSPESPMPFLSREKPNTVIGYLRESYNKAKASEYSYEADQAASFKPLLDLMEKADTGQTPKQSDTTGAATPLPLDPAKREAILQQVRDAIQAGDITTVDAFLKQGLDVNEIYDQDPLLYYAVDANKPAMVGFLISKGADVNKKTTWSDTCFKRACWRGYKEIADILLKAGAERNDLFYYAGTGDVNGLEALDAKTPIKGDGTEGDPIEGSMAFAAASGNQNTLEWLWKHKAPSDPAKKEKLLGILYKKAASWNQVDILRYLGTLGVNPAKMKGDAGPTLLFDAQQPETAEFLIQQGVDVNAKAEDGDTALLAICYDDGGKTAEVARVLLKHGADPNARDDYGITPLMRAHDGATVDVLVEAGADLKARSKEGYGVLEMNPPTADSSRLKALVRHGVPFDPKADGPSMLVHAAWSGQVDVMAFLLAQGIDPNVEGFFNKERNDLMTPLKAACISGEIGAAKVLLDHGAKVQDIVHADGHSVRWNEMEVAINNRKTAIVRMIWEHGFHVVSELTYAISQGAPASEIKKLLDSGIPPDPPVDKHITPLELASELGSFDTVKLLVDRKANINGNNPKLSPMSSAAYQGKDEIVEYLLQHGARPDPGALEEAANNSIPYDSDRSQEHFERAAKLLIDAGALKAATPGQEGSILAGCIQTRSGDGADVTVLKMLLDAGINPESPIPPIYLRDNEKATTVIGYFRDMYGKIKDSNKSYETHYAAALKPLLDMMEKAAAARPPKPAGA